MRLLLDSHVLLWWLGDDARLRPVLDVIIEAQAVYVSAATVWELGIKAAMGKLQLPGPLSEVLPESHFEALPITVRHAEAAALLPPIHADPFDRMLIAQAELERLVLVTHDLALRAYGGSLLKL